MSGEAVFQVGGQFYEAVTLAFLFVDILEDDDTSGDLSLIVENGNGGEADPGTGAVAEVAKVFFRPDGSAAQDRGDEGVLIGAVVGPPVATGNSRLWMRRRRRRCGGSCSRGDCSGGDVAGRELRR